MYSWFVPRVVFPAYEWVSGRRLWTEVLRLRELQWRSPEELEGRALDRLRSLLAHAAAHVPYYRALFADAGVRPDAIRALSDLARVPITTKAALRRRFPHDTTAANLPARRRWKRATSGSTGLPFEFYLDRAGTDAWLGSYLFFLEWAGAALWHLRVDLAVHPGRSWRSGIPGSRLARMVRRGLLGEDVREVACAITTPVEFRDTLSVLSRRRDYFLRVYPAAAGELARRMLEDGVQLDSRPRAVISSAETLTPTSAAIMERAFGSRVVNHYSSWEVLHLAQTCPDNPGVLHVNSERALVRVVREDGSPAAPGESGRILVTALSNYVMPFINYDTGDVAALGPPCACGRGFPTLSSLDGRSVEMIRAPSGKLLSPIVLNQLSALAASAPYIWEYQAVHVAPDLVRLLVVPTSRFDTAFAARLHHDLAAVLEPGMRVEVETVDCIPVEPSGKRLIVKPLPPAGVPDV